MLAASRKFGFTLIELLIVVAIIAILAAIAVPNFLEAQTRSKVSRAKSDLRTITTAVEAYHVDNNAYPLNQDINTHFAVTPESLTTPVAYLSSRPLDPFKSGKDVATPINPATTAERFYYDYYSTITPAEYIALFDQGVTSFIIAVDNEGVAIANRGAFQKYGKWLQWSVGPDQQFWHLDDDFVNPNNSSAGLKPPIHLPWGYSFDVPYDPTNGTTSFGNIIRSQRRADGAEPYQP